MNTNLRGVYYCIRSFAPLMIRGRTGHIITSHRSPQECASERSAYSASKWGLNGLTYSVAEEFARPQHSRLRSMSGSVHTDFTPHAGKSPEKMLQPGDVAHVVAMIVTQAPQSFASEILLRPTQKP